MLFTQTANRGVEYLRVFIDLIHVALAFDFLLANAVRLVPVQLGSPYLAAGEADRSDAFELAPAARAILPPQTCAVADLGADGNGFNLGDLADDFKAHRRLIVSHAYRDRNRPTLLFTCAERKASEQRCKEVT